MPLIKSSEAPQFEVPGVCFEGLVAPSRGSSENSAWRVSISPGLQGMPHSVTREEIFIALSGSATALIGDETFHVETGDALIVPANTSFSLSNPGSEPFEAVAILPVGGKAVTPEGEFIPPWAR